MRQVVLEGVTRSFPGPSYEVLSYKRTSPRLSNRKVSHKQLDPPPKSGRGPGCGAGSRSRLITRRFHQRERWISPKAKRSPLLAEPNFCPSGKGSGLPRCATQRGSTPSSKQTVRAQAPLTAGCSDTPCPFPWKSPKLGVTRIRTKVQNTLAGTAHKASHARRTMHGAAHHALCTMHSRRNEEMGA